MRRGIMHEYSLFGSAQAMTLIVLESDYKLVYTGRIKNNSEGILIVAISTARISHNDQRTINKKIKHFTSKD